jgi:hypothetical protein
VSPEKGGVLRTDVRRAFQRSILVVAAVVLPVAPLAALNSSTPHQPTHRFSLAAPSQQPLAAHITSTTQFHESVSWQLRHYVIVVKPPRRVVHHAIVTHHVVTHVVPPVVHHRVPKPRHIVVLHPNHKIGFATWYDWHPGQCATSYRPHGTRIWIRDLDTGRVITCLVTDTQAYNPQRVVDLSQTQFAELAPLSVGIVRVEVSW